MTMTILAKKIELHSHIFYFFIEVFIFMLISLLVVWFLQSKQEVIKHIEPPKVFAVTTTYVDIEWHNKRLLNCDSFGTPAFYTPLASEILPTRPVASSLDEQTFIRRYYFPEHLLQLHQSKADPTKDYIAELRILITAHCNPLWSNQQLVRVSFMMPKISKPH